ncbi:MAG TPA: TOPRIM nucleotidyl transferase/hydrolase domain-containing protein [Magnetospirillum sp.]|nr:TOPRIM nucleotidyl transferase/hydrolase domain-containing protein [Magnetospirillum sp.]
MRFPEQFTNILIDREGFRACPLLSQSEFIRLCRDCGMSVDLTRLQKLERLGLFFPVLRIYRPDIKIKVEYVDGGRRYRDLGPLEEGENWTGDTISELAEFGFGARYIRGWREEGFAWDPRVVASSHMESIETESRRHEAYFSRFQIYDLDFLLNSLTLHVQMEWSLGDDGSPAKRRTAYNNASMAKHVKDIIETLRDGRHGDIAAALCQLVSDRYFPKTQTDERRITLSSSLDFHKWDWYAFCREWDASQALIPFDMSAKDLNGLYDGLTTITNHVDPIEAWHPLTRFIRVEKRKKLKGDALKAVIFREMARMLAFAYRDRFGEGLPDQDEIGRQIFIKIPDIRPEDDPLRTLELVANDFGLNPKPQLVLLIEGETEETVIPIIVDKIWATSLGVIGVELVNLKGVANATGPKKGNDHSALWRFIDYHHHHQTIVMVLMDNEGNASEKLAKRLTSASSLHFPDRRVTRRNYVKLWKLSFELDNFSDTELALALTSFSGALFTAKDVSGCRQAAKNPPRNGGKLLTIGSLFRDRTGHDLDKPEFAKTLIDLMLDPSCRRSPGKRPIVQYLDKVIERASRNHQPTTQAMWEYNQRTGYLGTLKPGAAARRKDPFGRSRRRR